MAGSTHELGVLFEYHRNDAITAHNLSALVAANPGIPIIPICTGPISEHIPGSVQASACGALGEWWMEVAKDAALAWRHCDIPHVAWYASKLRTIACRRWILMEYDLYCTMDLLDFIRPTMHADVIAPSIPMTNRELDWHWFKEVPQLPAHMRPFASGLVPLVTAILSDEALAHIAHCYCENQFDAFCELRLGTIANYLGYQAVPNSHLAARNVSWQGKPRITTEKSLWHPVKSLPGCG